MTTTTLDLKVTADARSAVHGLKPLQTSLDNVTKDADKAESALKDLDKSHKISLNDAAIETAQKEIRNLRQQMAKDLSIDATANVTAAQRRIRQLQSAVKTLDADDVKIDVDVDTQDIKQAKDDLEDLDRLGKTGGGLVALGGTMSLIATGAGAAVVALGGLAVGMGVGSLASLNLADQMANAKIAFEQFLGGAKPAEKFLDDLSAFAAKTPFEFPELVDSSKKLLAFGIEGKDVVGLMQTLGDAAALTGADVGDLATIWGQMSAKGKVSNEELLQLTEAGVPALGLLADAMGLTVGEVQKMAEEGKLLSDDVLPVLQGKMDKTFGGGMAKQAETLSGKMSTLKDTLAGFGREVGAALTPFADILLSKIQPALDDLAQWAKENKGTITIAITEGIARAIDAFASLLDVGGFVVGMFADIVESITGVSSAIGGFLINVGELISKANDIPGVGAAIPDDLGSSLTNAGEDMVDFGQDIVHGMRTVEGGLHLGADAVRETADSFRSAGREMADSFKGDELTAKINKVKGELDDLQAKPRTAQVDADIKEAQAKLRALRRERREWEESRATAKLDANVSGAQKKLKDWRASLRYLRTLKPTTQVKADIKEAQAKIRQFRREMREAVKKRTAPIDAKITGAQNKAKNIKKTLADLGKKKSTPKVEAKTKAAQDALKRVQTRIANLKKAKANIKVGVKGDTSGITARLKAIQGAKRTAKIDVTAPKANATKTTIDGIATKKRTATIGTDVSGEATTRSTLDNLAQDRYSTIYVTTVRRGGGGGGGGAGPGAQSLSLVPQLFEANTAQIAGLRTTSKQIPQMVVGTPQAVKAPIPRGGTVTQLAPRQVPIKIYLDGAEIADHLTLKAGRLGTTSSARRRA